MNAAELVACGRLQMDAERTTLVLFIVFHLSETENAGFVRQIWKFKGAFWKETDKRGLVLRLESKLK